MDGGKFWEIMSEGEGSARGEEARLPHPSTKRLPKLAGTSNKLLAPNQTRTNGSTWRRGLGAQRDSYAFGQTVELTESLAEAGTDRVEGLREHVERQASLYSSMPDARTIKVHFDAAFVRKFRNTNYFVLGKYRSTKCILQLYYLGRTTAASSAGNNSKIRGVRTDEFPRLVR